MSQDYWHKQTVDKPLFGDLLWSRPENRLTAGKLLIIGGNEQGFIAPSEAFKAAQAAGAGTVRMVLPESLRRYIGPVFETGVLAPTAPSGGFSRAALNEFLMSAGWADGVLVAGDLGRGSETAIVLEQFAATYSGQLTLTKDAVDCFIKTSATILQRPSTTLVLSLTQLQQLARAVHFEQAITFNMDLLHLVDFLHLFTKRYQINIIVKHVGSISVGTNGQVSTTKLNQDTQVQSVLIATHATVWWLQNSTKTFEALSAATYEISLLVA